MKRWLAVWLALGLGASLAQGVVLRALMEDVPETRIIEALLPEFERATGIRVEFEKVQYGAMHDKLVAQFLAPENAYDFLEVDFLWAGEFPAAGWLEPLEPYVKASGFDLSVYYPSMLDLVGYYQGKLYMIPMYNYAMGLIYRKDLLERKDLKDRFQAQHKRPLALPRTLEEYVELSLFMAKNAGVSGAAMQGQRGDPNFMEFSNYLFAAGGDYVDRNWRVTLNSPQGEKALSLYVRNIREAAPKGALNFNLDDTFRVMCQGQAFSMVTYWWMLPQLDDAKQCPKVAGKVALAPMPGGAGVNGGWGWAIPKNSRNKEAAWKFISWVESKEIVKKRALMGHAPTRKDAFQDPEVLRKYPYYRQAEAIIAKARKVPIFAYTAEMEDVVGREISLAAAGQKAVKQALQDAAKGLEGLLRKAGLLR
ncbi:ABC transporter substrate-binding protein [Thermus scotoductus]|uniref:ABC transporter substrate-binding protein n=1 Tax=Thermus scotoductus TaxID=37636 RepID=A0A430R637_THESC|nr:extracellular solute-binding protein [Thermus scotoductus]RTH02876.1 ABC transporter substrate-binding protein [Thermus scotoductus]RTH06073.1 ABC transporter substrate-binding protein [Thermus scotoductus]